MKYIKYFRRSEGATCPDSTFVLMAKMYTCQFEQFSGNYGDLKLNVRESNILINNCYSYHYGMLSHNDNEF